MKNSFALLLLLAVSFAGTAAHAADFLPYTDAKFAELSKADKPVLLEVFADWCPTCRVQQPMLKQVVSAAPYDQYTVLVIDFDSQADVRAHYKVERQSTLIVFTGTQERGRATGYIDQKSISLLLNKGLDKGL
jgi:thioredoxin 1